MPKKNINPEEKEKKLREELENKQKYWGSGVFGNTNHRIINNDSQKIGDYLDDNSVDFIVTSPPYFNAKSYSQWDNLDSYLNEMKNVFRGCFNVLKSGRKFCLNISDLPVKGDYGVKRIPLGSYLTAIMEETGFELSDRIIWNKYPIKGFQYGSLPYPPSPLVCDSMEYILVFRKPGKSDYTYLDRDKKEASKLSREEYGEYTKQIWTMGRVRLKDNLDGHIAPYPEELPLRCIKLYSFVGDVVLDPFGGSGTTSIVAANLKRNSVLFELKNEYIELIKKRVNETSGNLFINPTYLYEY